MTMDDAAIERAREAREEEEYETAVEAASVLDIRAPFVGVKSALVRDWVRAALVPSAVKRLYDIGMGVTRFDVPTMAGNTVRVPAPAAVQTRALQGIIGIGVPQQLGLLSDEDNVPGVIAVGEWELAAARGDAEPDPTAIGPVDLPPSNDSIAHALGDVLGEYRPPAGHDVVVVDESDVTNDVRAELPPPPVNPERNALAKAILANRRAARSGPHDGPRAGDHPNHV